MKKQNLIGLLMILIFTMTIFIVPGAGLSYAEEANSTDNQGQMIQNNIPLAVTGINKVNVAKVVGGKAIVTVDKSRAATGDTVTVSIKKISAGMQLASIAVTGASGTVTTVEVIAGSRYTFTMPAEAVTVTVMVKTIPPISYTVTFDSQGGSAVDPITGIQSGATVTLPSAPTRSLYTFASWNTAANGSGTTFDASTPVTADITVYAQWNAAALSNIATLSDLKVNGSTLPGFNPAGLGYGYYVPLMFPWVNPVVTYSTTDSNATAVVTYYPQDAASVVVMAQDGTTQKTYWIKWIYLNTATSSGVLSSPSEVTLSPGGSIQLVVTYRGTATGPVHWFVNPAYPSILTVDYNTGLVTVSPNAPTGPTKYSIMVQMTTYPNYMAYTFITIAVPN